jgi:hypothetical protein
MNEVKNMYYEEIISIPKRTTDGKWRPNVIIRIFSGGNFKDCPYYFKDDVFLTREEAYKCGVAWGRREYPDAGVKPSDFFQDSEKSDIL